MTLATRCGCLNPVGVRSRCRVAGSPLARQTERVDSRGWWTVGLTALAGPLGAVAGAFLFYTIGGDGLGLAAGVGGLILGGPLAAVAVFGICLLTLLRDWGLKGRIAMSLMVAAALLDAIIIVLALRAIGGSSFADTALYGIGIMSMAVLGAGAHVAITTADR